jgi:hypothetical protein
MEIATSQEWLSADNRIESDACLSDAIAIDTIARWQRAGIGEGSA